MNNKLFARIMTAVICICMMSTVVFAANTAVPELNADNTAIVFSGEEGYTSAEDQITIMAFAVEKGTAPADVVADGTGIVAINQVGGTVGFKTVPINPAIFAEDGVAEGKDIAVMVGGSNGDVKTFVISEQSVAPEPTTYDVAYVLNNDSEATGYPTTFTTETIAAFFENVADPTKAATETEEATTTYEFAGWYTDAEFANAVDKASTAAMTTLLGASTRVTFYARWNETVTPKQPAGGNDIVVTFTNGDATTPVTAVDGKVTLPTAADTAFWGTPATGLTFTLYSWVALDASNNVTAEYKLADTTQIDVTENVTLYAKYDTGYKIGDINLDTVVEGADTNLMFQRITRGRQNTNTANVGVTIYAGSSIKIGDINVDTVVEGADTNLMFQRITRGRKNTNTANIGKKVYIVHKTDVLVEE